MFDAEYRHGRHAVRYYPGPKDGEEIDVETSSVGLRLSIAFCACMAMLAPAVAQAETPPLWHSNSHTLKAEPIPFVANGRLSLSSKVVGELTCNVVSEGGIFNESSHGRGTFEAFSSSGCKENEPELECFGIAHCSAAGTVFITAELPLESHSQNGEVCSNGDRLLSECPKSSEREVRSVITRVARGSSSLPWKSELHRSVIEEEERIVQLTGMHAYGESASSGDESTACYPKTAGEPAGYHNVPAGCMIISVVFPAVPIEAVFYGSAEFALRDGAGNGLDASHFEPQASGPLVSAGGEYGTAELSGEIKVQGSESDQLLFAR